MPARAEEIKNAQEEGIQILTLTNPVKIIGGKCVEAVECIQMREGGEDDYGRKTSVKIEGTEFTIECDQAIIAVGQNPNPMAAKSGEIMTGGYGKILVNDSMQTSKDNVFAGGDAVSGSATVIKAIGDGNKAAEKIDEFLNKED
jgi:glutamate synthase (NADPH/NADH) small chain